VPFFPDLPPPIVKRELRELPLGPTEINLNQRILEIYMRAIDQLCDGGDDGEWGSAAVADAGVVDSISARVHRGGLNVADIKYLMESDVYDALVAAQDRMAITEKITNQEQEKRVIQRVMERGKRYNMNPGFIATFYRDETIPLTKEAEVLRIFEVAGRGQRFKG